jgi:hypothetical protein
LVKDDFLVEVATPTHRSGAYCLLTISAFDALVQAGVFEPALEETAEDC